MAEPGTTKLDQIIDLLTQQIAQQGDKAALDAQEKIEEKAAKEKKEQDTKNRNESKKLKKQLEENTIGLIGLSKSMFSLKNMVGNQMSMNSELAKNLGQVGKANEGTRNALDRFTVGAQGTEQAIKVFADAVDLGMTNFSNNTMQFGAQLKVLGVQNKTAFNLMRANTQALGLSEDGVLAMTDSLVSTAIANGDSIEGLIGALNSMKDAMIKTTVELGPKAAMNAQKIAARMSQGNTELQEASAKFVQSFLAGSDGFMKAAKLGVTFTGTESEDEMAAKFEQILARMGDLTAGKTGAGSQFLFDSFEASLGLTREDFNLQQQIGNSIGQLVQGNTEQLSAQSAAMNLEQQMLNATNAIQNNTLKLTEGAARSIQLATDGFGKLDGYIDDFARWVGISEEFIKKFPNLANWFVPLIAGVFGIRNFFKAGGFVKALAGLGRGGGGAVAGGAAKGAAKKGFFRGAARLLGRALPIGAIAMGLTDAIGGFMADKDAGIGRSLANAGSSLVNGLTFGLLGSSPAEIKEQAAGAVPPEASAAMMEGAQPAMMGMGETPTGGFGEKLVAAMNANTQVLKDILETNQDGNDLTERQTVALSDGGYIPIAAGRK